MLYRRALEILEAKSPGHQRIAETYSNLAPTLMNQGVKLGKEVSATSTLFWQLFAWVVSSVLTGPSIAYVRRKSCEAAVFSFSVHCGDFCHPPMRACRAVTVTLSWEMSNNDQALPKFQEALAIFEKAVGSDDPTTICALRIVAEVFEQLVRYVLLSARCV